MWMQEPSYKHDHLFWVSNGHNALDNYLKSKDRHKPIIHKDGLNGSTTWLNCFGYFN
jgi:hypothetical protein